MEDLPFQYLVINYSFTVVFTGRISRRTGGALSIFQWTASRVSVSTLTCLPVRGSEHSFLPINQLGSCQRAVAARLLMSGAHYVFTTVEISLPRFLQPFLLFFFFFIFFFFYFFFSFFLLALVLFFSSMKYGY